MSFHDPEHQLVLMPLPVTSSEDIETPNVARQLGILFTITAFVIGNLTRFAAPSRTISASSTHA